MAKPTPVRELPPPIVHGVSQGSNRISAYLANQQKSPDKPVLLIGDSHATSGLVAAHSTIRVNIPGISFYFLVVSGAGTTGILARPVSKGETRSFHLFFAGTGLRLGQVTFDAVEIFNDTGSTVNFQIEVGGGSPTGFYDEYIDNRAIVDQSINPGGSLVQNAATFVVGFTTRSAGWANSLGAGATQVVTDGYLGKARKQIMFSNNDAAATLQVVDSGGNVVGTIQPSTAFTFESGGTVGLKNPSGAPVACNIGEVYYT